MSRHGARRDHNTFCRIEEWQEVRNARGKRVAHHNTYELQLPDGRVLRTRVSHPVNNDTYGSRLWAEVLRQLDVDEDVFWTCVDDRELPDRGQEVETVPANALPAALAYQLINVAGVPEKRVATMTLPEAVATMSTHWSQPRA